jgi:hypothetical protein
MTPEVLSALAAQVAAATGQPPQAPAVPSGTTAQPVVPTLAQASPVVAPIAAPPPVANVGITLTAEQWAAYTSGQARVAELEEIERRRATDAQAAEVRALQAKGQIEAAFNLQREQARTELETERRRLKDTEDRAKRYALDGELARALASQPLVNGGVEQLSQLWRSQFIVEPQGDSFAVRSPDFQPVGAWVAAQLGRPEYSHFLKPQNQHGGTQGASQGVHGSPTPPASPTVEPGPRNLSEAVLMTMAATEKSKLDPRVTPSLGFGLRPMVRA